MDGEVEGNVSSRREASSEIASGGEYEDLVASASAKNVRQVPLRFEKARN